jgi:20S proteasome alpha/beta subunit
MMLPRPLLIRCRKRRKVSSPVTVCIAAICRNGIVIGASDRMLTAGDIEFEPERAKIFPITTSIIAMTAGDASLQDELMAAVRIEAGRRIDTENRWLTVQEIAELHGDYFSRAKSQRAESALLAPLGLNRETFMNKQAAMLSGLVEKIANEMINFQVPDVDTIFAGVDERGPHIYLVRNAEVSCRDSVGFATIGAGEWHAASQMMFAGHTPNKWFPDSVLSVYAAKKRAEVAPGVGKATDMFIVASLGGYNRIDDDEIEEFGKIYELLRAKELTAYEEARNNSWGLIQALVTDATPKDQSAIPESTEPATPSLEKGSSQEEGLDDQLENAMRSAPGKSEDQP